MNYSYQTAHVLDGKRGNNVFSYEERKAKYGHEPTLYIPARKVGMIDDVTIGHHIVFEEMDEGKLFSCKGLEYFIQFQHPSTGAPVIVFDNHNHAFYFWAEALQQGSIRDGARLLHVDQHKDMRRPERLLGGDELNDLEKVWEYVNYELQVGNFIVPAKEIGLIDEIHFLDNEPSFAQSYEQDTNTIVDIDLDIFAEEMDYMDFEPMIKKTKGLMEGARVITIATSPFFIDQERALRFLHRLFN